MSTQTNTQEVNTTSQNNLIANMNDAALDKFFMSPSTVAKLEKALGSGAIRPEPTTTEEDAKTDAQPAGQPVSQSPASARGCSSDIGWLDLVICCYL